MPVLNVELLQQTLHTIMDRPELWNQAAWKSETECGTAYCFAGWACKLSGAKWAHDFESVLIANDEDDYTDTWVKDGELHTCVSTRARRLLGLTCSQADILFDTDNSLSDLQAMVRELVVGGTLDRQWVEKIYGLLNE